MVQWIAVAALFFYNVVQVQPFTPAYDTLPDATQWQAPYHHKGTYVVLKHSDPMFPQLELGDLIVAGIDGVPQTFGVVSIRDHWLEDPLNPSGPFYTFETREWGTWDDFYNEYFRDGALILMTCTNGPKARVLVIAWPMDGRQMTGSGRQ